MYFNVVSKRFSLNNPEFSPADKIMTFMTPCFQELRKHEVTVVVRVCEPSYKTDPLTSAGIELLVREEKVEVVELVCDFGLID